MKPRDFCYWLQGSFDLADATSPYFWGKDSRELVKMRLNSVDKSGNDDPDLVRFIEWMEKAMANNVPPSVVLGILDSALSDC